MKLSSESYAEPVFTVLKDGHYAAYLEHYPFPTPVFRIQRLPTNESSLWRVNTEFDIGFTEDMLQRTDVLEFIIQARAFIDTRTISTIRDTIGRLLNHWKKIFPQGVPDAIM